MWPDKFESHPMIFLDTEFYELGKAGPQLLSLGLAGDHGELYCELDMAAVSRLPRRGLSPFLRDEVLGQFGKVPGAAGDLNWVARQVSWWLRNCPGPLDVHYDYSTDFELLENLLGASSNVLVRSLRAVHVGYLLDDPEGVAAAERCWAELRTSRGLRRHHALADAHALRARFAAVHGM